MNRKEEKIAAKNNLVWEIYSPDETASCAQKLKKACELKDIGEIRLLLSDAKLLRSLIVRRGEKNEYFIILKLAFGLFVDDKFGPETGIENIPAEDLMKYLRSSGISEKILNELAAVAYHERDKEKFFFYVDLIDKNRGLIKNPASVARAIHDLASWHGSHRNSKMALEKNKQALTLANEIGEKTIAAKSKFGLSYNKDYLKPKLQAEDFIKLAKTLEKEGIYYDALRAKIEAAKALVKLALRQEKNTQKETLLSAKNLALQALKSAKDYQYPNAEIQSREILSRIYAATEDIRKHKSYKKQADDLREKYDYKTLT